MLQIFNPFTCSDLSFKYCGNIQPLLHVLMCQAAFEMGSRTSKAPEDRTWKDTNFHGAYIHQFITLKSVFSYWDLWISTAVVILATMHKVSRIKLSCMYKVSTSARKHGQWKLHSSAGGADLQSFHRDPFLEKMLHTDSVTTCRRFHLAGS